MSGGAGAARSSSPSGRCQVGSAIYPGSGANWRSGQYRLCRWRRSWILWLPCILAGHVCHLFLPGTGRHLGAIRCHSWNWPSLVSTGESVNPTTNFPGGGNTVFYCEVDPIVKTVLNLNAAFFRYANPPSRLHRRCFLKIHLTLFSSSCFPRRGGHPLGSDPSTAGSEIQNIPGNATG